MIRLPLFAIRSLVLLTALSTGNLFARGGITLDEAVEDARSRGGRVISAETLERDGHQVHNIRLLTKDGKVQRIRIDGSSGLRMQGRPRR